MNNIEKYSKCHMRTSLGNCDPIGGFCTSVKTTICEALHKAADRPTGEWVQVSHKKYLPYDCEPEWTNPTYNVKEHSIIEEYWHCNRCNYEADRHFKPRHKFCPNCGAKMLNINSKRTTEIGE